MVGRNLVLANVAANDEPRRAPAQTRGSGDHSGIIEPHPVDDAFISGQAEQTGLGIAILWQRRHRSNFNEAETQYAHLLQPTCILVKSRCQAHRIGKCQSSDFHFELLGAHGIKRPQQRTHTGNGTSKRQQRHRPLVGLFGLQFKNQWLQRLVHGAKIVRFLGLAVEKTVDSECAATPRQHTGSE